ncbi:MAG: DNA polymerase III subunit delta [Candidatus Omnitrophota bacterium]|nr:MAG: DNA polymerase III subunit delta [Candidatus Omnitrophota bacterium]
MNYLLTGPEEYLKHQFVEKLKKSILNNDKNLTLDFEIFRGGEKDFTRISDSFNTIPFTSNKRLVVIKDIDRLRLKEKKLILKYLKSPVDSTVLVLESSSDNFDKPLKEIAGFTKLVRCNRLKDRERDWWIKKEFAGRGKKISPALASLVRELLGDDLFLLKNEIEKIASFLGDENEVTERHIETVLGKVAKKSAFDLVNFILENRPDKALYLVDSLLVKEKPHQILNLLAWQFRKNRNSRALEIILEADFFIKSGKIDMRHALERVLVLLCRGRA